MSDQNDKYFTIWYGVYNRVKRELSYASAGHPPAILLSPAATPAGKITLKRLRTPGMPIGMMPDTTYQLQRAQVVDNSRLYIFSDGVYEIQPADRHSSVPLLGLDGFVRLLVTLESRQQLSLDTLIQQVSAFGGNRFEDDLSLLEIDFHPA